MCATSLLVKRLTENETFQSASSLLALYYKFQSLSCLCANASLSGCVCVYVLFHMKREHIYYSNNLQYEEQIVSSRQKYTKQIFSVLLGFI